MSKPLHLIIFGAFCLTGLSTPPIAAADVVVGSKNFAENRLLAEMYAQLIEERLGLEVDRQLGLAGTEFCFEALKSGAIHLYPEYTGTGLVTILGHEPGGTPVAALTTVRREFLDRWNLWWLGPMGFENAYEIAVPRALATEHGLSSISDLVSVAPELRAGFGSEFVERDDGLPGLERIYGLRFASVQTLLEAPKYQAAGTGAVDVLDVYTTDGRLLTYDLVVLEDDLGSFPPYQAAPLVNGDLLERHPGVGSTLALLADSLDEEAMRALNLRLQRDKERVEVVATDALIQLGLVAGSDLAVASSGTSDAPAEREGFIAYLVAERFNLLRLTGQHLALVGMAILAGVLTSLPLAFWLATRNGGLAELAIRGVGMTQTIPSLALLGFLIPVLGVGAPPALFALWVYSVFPILRGAYSGLRDADPRAVEAAEALGMTSRQVLYRVRLPLAASPIMAGLRTAAVITVGTATLAAFIGGGGLGEPIIAGVQLVDTYRILSGAIPAALLALAVDFVLGRIELHLRPRGIAS